MKVIFLDIDGALNSGHLEKNTIEPIDRNNAALLKAITEETGAVVVLSSGWRFRFDDNMKPVSKEADCLYSILDELGIRLFGKTPDFSTEEIRRNRTFSKVKAKEIKAWLDVHENVDSFVVLDDLDLNDAEINARAIRVNNNTGLAENDATRAIRMLLRE